MTVLRENFNPYPRRPKAVDDGKPPLDRLAEELEFRRRQALLAGSPTQYYRQLNSKTGSTRLRDLTAIRSQTEDDEDGELDMTADSSPFDDYEKLLAEVGKDIKPLRLPPREVFIDKSEMRHDSYVTCDGVLMIKTGEHTAVRKSALSRLPKLATKATQTFALAA